MLKLGHIVFLQVIHQLEISLVEEWLDHDACTGAYQLIITKPLFIVIIWRVEFWIFFLRHVGFQDKKTTKRIAWIPQSQILIITGLIQCQELSGANMSESAYFVKDRVASSQRINSLNLPAAVGEEKAVRVALNINLLTLLRLQPFDIVIIDDCFVKIFVSCDIDFILLFQFAFFDASFWPFDGFTSVHPSNLPSEEVWLIREQLVHFNLRCSEITFGFEVLKSDDVATLNVILSLVLLIVTHK